MVEGGSSCHNKRAKDTEPQQSDPDPKQNTSQQNGQCQCANQSSCGDSDDKHDLVMLARLIPALLLGKVAHDLRKPGLKVELLVDPEQEQDDSGEAPEGKKPPSV